MSTLPLSSWKASKALNRLVSKGFRAKKGIRGKITEVKTQERSPMKKTFIIEYEKDKRLFPNNTRNLTTQEDYIKGEVAVLESFGFKVTEIKPPMSVEY